MDGFWRGRGQSSIRGRTEWPREGEARAEETDTIASACQPEDVGKVDQARCGRALPGLQRSESALVCEGVGNRGRGLRSVPNRPHPRFHPRFGLLGRPAVGPARYRGRRLDDPAGTDGGASRGRGIGGGSTDKLESCPRHRRRLDCGSCTNRLAGRALAPWLVVGLSKVTRFPFEVGTLACRRGPNPPEPSSGPLDLTRDVACAIGGGRGRGA
jgi:hypothetical protein